MKTRNTFIAAAIVAVMACSAANAQVLGGSVGGAVNGALGGGLRDASVFGNGNAAGSFGGELDTGSMLRKTRGAAEDTTRRARNVGGNVRNRVQSSASTAHDAGVNLGTSAVGTARDAGTSVAASAVSTAHSSANVATSAVATADGAKEQQLSTAASLAGSTASHLDATSFSTGADGAVSKSVAIEPQQDVGLGGLTSDVSGGASGNASASRKGLVADVAADGDAVANLAVPKKSDATTTQEVAQTNDAPKRDRSTL